MSGDGSILAQTPRKGKRSCHPNLRGRRCRLENRIVLGTQAWVGRRRVCGDHPGAVAVIVCGRLEKKTGLSVRGSVLRQLRDGHSGAANTAGETADASDLPGCASCLCVTRDGSTRPKNVSSPPSDTPRFCSSHLRSLSFTQMVEQSSWSGWVRQWLCCSIARMRHTGHTGDDVTQVMDGGLGVRVYGSR